MKEFPTLMSATALPGFVVKLEYSDGTVGEVNFTKWKNNGGLFDYWTIGENFSKIYINERGVLAWTEDIEFDADSLYLDLVGKTFYEYARN